MTNYTIKFYDFITIYNLLLTNLAKRENNYEISLFYLNNEFNINIKIENTTDYIYNDHFKVSKEEYDYLTSIIGYEFISNHKINLPYFKDLERKDAYLYYLALESQNEQLDYDKAKVHILANSKFKLKLYYFKGLNKLSYDMQDIALEKLNKKTLIKS